MEKLTLTLSQSTLYAHWHIKITPLVPRQFRGISIWRQKEGVIYFPRNPVPIPRKPHLIQWIFHSCLSSIQHKPYRAAHVWSTPTLPPWVCAFLYWTILCLSLLDLLVNSLSIRVKNPLPGWGLTMRPGRVSPDCPKTLSWLIHNNSQLIQTILLPG